VIAPRWNKAAASHHADHCNRAWQMSARIESEAKIPGKFNRIVVKICRFHRHILPVIEQNAEFRDRN
jgi:hypothetical protein